MTAIESWLPHRAPFRFVDDVVEVEGDTGRFRLALALDDPRLAAGHLQPLYLVEALAQSTAAFNGYTRPDRREAGLLVEFQAAFHAAARGGDTVVLEVRLIRQHGPYARYTGLAKVGERLLVAAELTVMRTPGAPDA